MNAHEYRRTSRSDRKCRYCHGGKLATPHLQWLDEQDAMEEEEEEEKTAQCTAEYFSQSDDERYDSCLKCGSLVRKEDIVIHAQWHLAARL